MMTGRVIADGLGKRFNRYTGDRAWTLKHALAQGWPRRRRLDPFWAVQDVAFEVRPGEMLGLIGHNGAGKSTLLRLIGGVLRPDTGSVHASGRVSGLLELNSGMHPELSGRDNVFIGGVVAGLSSREVRAKFDEIVAFAELEQFIDNPIRTYSAGMKLRLGFAVAVHGRPGVLLIDEVLSVGDGAFQAKCLERIRRFKEEGSAIILSTHDLGQMTSMCERALWLRGGRVVALDAADLVAADYRLDMATQVLGTVRPDIPDETTEDGIVLRAGENRFGNMGHRITGVRLLNDRGQTISAIESGSGVRIEVNWRSEQEEGAPVLAVSLGQAGENNALDLNNVADGAPMLAQGGVRRAVLALDRLDLAAGRYRLNVGLYADGWTQTHDYHHAAYPLEITASRPASGVLNPPRQWLFD